MLAASSPELFVGRHVLLRLCVPRYPPSALISLTNHSLVESKFFASSFKLVAIYSFLVAMQFSRFTTGKYPAV